MQQQQPLPELLSDARRRDRNFLVRVVPVEISERNITTQGHSDVERERFCTTTRIHVSHEKKDFRGLITDRRCIRRRREERVQFRLVTMGFLPPRDQTRPCQCLDRVSNVFKLCSAGLELLRWVHLITETTFSRFVVPSSPAVETYKRQPRSMPHRVSRLVSILPA